MNSLTTKTRESAEHFLFELREKTYLHYSGKVQEYDLDKLYSRYQELFAKKNIELLLKEHQQSGDRSVKYLLKFIVEVHIGQAVKDIDSQIAKAERTGVVAFKDEKLPYRSLLGKIFNATDNDERHELDELRRHFIAHSNELRAKRITIANEMSESLGFSHYAAFCEEFKEVAMQAYCNDCMLFLEKTHQEYFNGLLTYLKQYGIDQKNAERSDMLLIARAVDFDNLFSPDKLISSMQNTLTDLGIHLRQQTNIMIDMDDRAYKAARPFCIAVETPNDIRLVFKVIGGREDFMNLFHEMGHAQHFAHIGTQLPFEYKSLGDYGVTEGFAFLFQSLVSNALWLGKHLDCTDTRIDDYIKLSRFLKLYLMRRYAVKMIYEHELFCTSINDSTAIAYSSMLSKYLGVKYWPEDYLHDIDVSFYCLNYIRAFVQEDRLNRVMKNKFGETWLFSAEAGNYLKKLWSYGQVYSSDELCRCICGYNVGLSDCVA